MDFVNEARNLFPDRKGSSSGGKIQSGNTPSKMGKLKMKKWDSGKMAGKVSKLKMKAKDKYGQLDRDEAVSKLRIKIPQNDDK